MNLYYLGFIPRIFAILVSAWQFDKANRERNLGFTILWFIIILVLCSYIRVEIKQ